MSLKIKVFKKNTPWGVIRKADGSLIYKHVVNFPDPSKKDEFVFNFLLSTDEQDTTTIETWKDDLFLTLNTQTVQTINEKRIQLKVTPENVKINHSDLLNADFAVIKRDNLYKYYALKLKEIQKGVFIFECEIDVFFTYKVNFRDNAQNYVNHAHLNRLTSEGNAFKKPWDFPELLYAKEDIEVPLVNQTIINREKRTDNPWATPPPNLQWMVIYRNTQAEPGNSTPSANITALKENRVRLIHNQTDQTDLNYEIIIVPFINPLKQKHGEITQVKLEIYDDTSLYWNPITLVTTLREGTIPVVSSYFNSLKHYEHYYDDQRTIKIEIMNECPFYFPNDQVSRIFKKKEKKEKKNKKLKQQTTWLHFYDYIIEESIDPQTGQFVTTTIIRTSNPTLKTGSVRYRSEVDVNNPFLCFYIYNVGGTDIQWNQDKVTFEDNPNTPFKYYFFLENFIENKDPKIYSSQFTKLFGKSYYSNFFYWEIERLMEPVKVSVFTSFATDNTNQIFSIDQKGRDNLLSGNFIVDEVNSDMPIWQNLEKEFLASNANQIKTRRQMYDVELKNTQRQAITGAISSVSSGINTLNPIAFATSALSIGGNIASAGFDYRHAGKVHNLKNEAINSQLKDLSTQPQPVRLTGEKWFEQFALTEHRTDVNFGILTPTVANETQILDRFNRYGYQLNKLYNLNTLLENRKFWNYIEAQDCFNSINLQISSPLKQIIGDALAEGLTLWHYRTLADWQGILSYGRENEEINWNFLDLKKIKKWC